MNLFSVTWIVASRINNYFALTVLLDFRNTAGYLVSAMHPFLEVYKMTL
jgi:hypothetical protein